ncbi:MAG TPA: nucleoside recognition protein, partial [Deltaproteobacteria bacterium]|nr:nucleoside recognition protein [Deltaproteobacteria bacterium]
MGRIRQAVLHGIRGYGELLAFLVPVYTAVFLLGRWGVLEGLASKAEPFMAFVGLPGKAALAVVLGNLVNLYAALGAAAGLGLTPKEMSLLGLMLLTSHSQIL